MEKNIIGRFLVSWCLHGVYRILRLPQPWNSTIVSCRFRVGEEKWMGTFFLHLPQKFPKKNTQQIPVRDKTSYPCQFSLSFSRESIVLVCGKGWPPMSPIEGMDFLEIMARYAVRSLGKKYLHKKMPSKNSSNLPVENFSNVRKKSPCPWSTELTHGPSWRLSASAVWGPRYYL